MIRNVKLSALLLPLGCIGALFLYIASPRISSWKQERKAFILSEITLHTVGARETTIPQGASGYILFYSNMVECAGCIREVNGLKKISEIYPEINFYAILKNDTQTRAFVEAMNFMKIPGDYLVDSRGKIQNRLGLSGGPQLLFFDSDMKLISVLPVNVDHDNLNLQIHRYIARM